MRIALATTAASCASERATSPAFASCKTTPLGRSSSAATGLIAAFAMSLPHRCGRMSYTVVARIADSSNKRAIRLHVSGEAPPLPTTVWPTPTGIAAPSATVSDDSVVAPSTSAMWPPSAVLIASSLPIPFCNEMIAVDGLSSPMNGRSARNVSVARTNTKSAATPNRSRGSLDAATCRPSPSPSRSPSRRIVSTTSRRTSNIDTSLRAASL